MFYSLLLKPPIKWRKTLLFVMPIMISQILQRLYPAIDSRYISYLGKDALLIHSLQYNFIIFGQFIGIATSMSCLVFWKRPECIFQQGSIFKRHLILVSILITVIAFFFGFQAEILIKQYKINSQYFSVAKTYFYIGLINMVLQSIHGSLDGMLVASDQQKKVLLISLVLLINNIISDFIIISYQFTGIQNPKTIYLPIIMIACSTTLAMAIACLVQAWLITKKVFGWNKIPYSELLKVWYGEIGIYLIRGIVPFLYALQLSFIAVSYGFFTSYQLALQVSYFFCIPLIASLQLSIRNASENSKLKNENNIVPLWWGELLYTGLLPSIFLLLLGMIFPTTIMTTFFRYHIPQDHIVFISIFFFACLIGQFANAATVPIRAKKKSYLITRNFLISEFIIMLGGTQILIILGIATPINIGMISIAFVTTQLLLNLFSIKKIKMQLT